MKEARTPAALVAAMDLIAKDNTPIVGEEVESDLGPVEDDSVVGEQE